MQTTTKSQAGHVADKQMFNAAGLLLQFLASPDEVGDALIIPGNVKHALRNNSSVPVTLALVTKSELYSFFQELAKPFDPHQPAATATPEAMQQLFQVAAKYGYWLTSPAENAAIGLNIV